MIFCAASLGVASRITVTIAASDDAHGVFQFSPKSLSVNGTEPEDGFNSVVLEVRKVDSLVNIKYPVVLGEFVTFCFVFS